MNCIHICYDLDLVAKLDSAGKMVPVQTLANERKKLELDYNFFCRVQRPTTLITEDGRVYHDCGLMAHGSCNAGRLKSFIDHLVRDYGGGDVVNKAYHQHRGIGPEN